MFTPPFEYNSLLSGPYGSESRTDFLDVVRGKRLAFEIPSSKLDTHDLFTLFPFVSICFSPCSYWPEFASSASKLPCSA